MSRANRLLGDYNDDADSESGYQRQYMDQPSVSNGWTKRHKVICGAIALLIVTVGVLVPILIIALKNNGSSNPPPDTPSGSTGVGPAQIPIPYVIEGHSHTDVVLLLPDVFGMSMAALELTHYYARQGYTAVLLDYFNRDPWNTSSSWDDWMARHPMNQTVEWTKQSVLALHSQGYTHIQAIGYCWGGKVGVALASDPSLNVKSVVVAHPSMLTADDAKGIVRPMSFVLPAVDDFTTDPTTGYTVFQSTMATNGIAGLFKIYPGTVHGFALQTNSTSTQAMQQRSQVLQDTLLWFLIHQDGRNSLPATGRNLTIANTPVYNVFPNNPNAVSENLLFLPDINGNSEDSRLLADFYANVFGYNVTLIDYVSAQPGPRPNVNVSTTITLAVLAVMQNSSNHHGAGYWATGYCHGGFVGVALASNASLGIENLRVAVAHPSSLVSGQAESIIRPIFFALPERDSFTTNLNGWPLFDTRLTERNIEHGGVVYLSQNHGFAVSKPSDVLGALNKTKAIFDTNSFLTENQ